MVADETARDGSPSWRRVTDGDLDRVQKFLETRLETSLFLLSGLTTYGPNLGDALFSGNFKLIEKGREIQAVFVLNRRGALHAQTQGRTDLCDPILSACKEEALPVTEVIGDLRSAEALWQRLRTQYPDGPHYESKEILYRLERDAGPATFQTRHAVKRLGPGDWEHWEALVQEYRAEFTLSVGGSSADRQANFVRQASAERCWGAFEDGRCVSIAALNAVHATTGLVGSVFTLAEKRRRGFARALMEAVIAQGRALHGLETFVLFTPETNTGAQSLYEALGFRAIGKFGLFSPRPAR